MTYKYFTVEELACKHCKENGTWDGKDYMDESFVHWVDELRERMNFPFIVTSAYRCPEHPIEARKSAPGPHSSGKAIDIQVSGKRAFKLLREALSMGFVGIGVNQKGDHSQRFIHLDMWFEGDRPTIWSY